MTASAYAEGMPVYCAPKVSIIIDNLTVPTAPKPRLGVAAVKAVLPSKRYYHDTILLHHNK